MSDKIKSQDVIAALRKRYPSAAWAFLEQVANGTGYAKKYRWADALAMGLWPSRGMELHGIEVKVSRSDWLRELENPVKADEIHKYCHRWYLAVSDEKIVKPGELPPNWGLYVFNKDKMECKQEAFCATKPEPLDLLMVASILRSAVKADEGMLNSIRNAGYSEGYESGKKYEASGLTRQAGELKELRESLAEFEKLSGLRVTRYTGPQIGAAVATVMKMGQGNYSLKQTKEACTKIIAGLDEIESFLAVK
jgi:hypothetical protein